MGGGSNELVGPDFAEGVAADAIADGASLLGHLGGEAVLLVRRGNEVFAIGASCTHYGGPLAEGLVVGETVRCPWHHARFSLRTGEAVGGPALNPVPCWSVERRGDRLHVLGKRDRVTPSAPAGAPSSVVVIGGGAAAEAAVETLRGEGYTGPVTMISAEEGVPVDRPNLSKDYLAGNAPEEWIPLRSAEFYAEQRIERIAAEATAIDVAQRRVTLADGRSIAYGALLLATGAEPLKLSTPGADRPHVRTLRTLADARAIIERAKGAKRAVVVGASFIGLEVAASLRARNLEVDVVAPDASPLARVLGPEIGAFVRKLHEDHGVRFHLGTKPKSIGDDTVDLEDGTKLPADLVVVGIGVRPRTSLAEKAGLRVENGVVVDGRLETSATGVYAAGDIARYPDPYGGELVRVEHWVVAERQGRTAARNILGKGERFADAPFFWSQHYDVPIAYVGHATSWDAIERRGDPAAGSCLWSFVKGGKIVAVASVGLDRDSLLAEAAMERGDAAAVASVARGA